MQEETNLRAKLLGRIDESGISDRKVSMLATNSPDTIRAIRRDASPRADTIDAICRTIGMEIRIKPAPGDGRTTALRTIEPTHFDAAIPLEVRSWSEWTGDGALNGPQPATTAPAPSRWKDLHGFYARLPAGRLEAGGIEAGDVCLVSPHAGMRTDALGWFKKRDRTETAGWIAATHADGFSIAGWRGSATPVHERIRRDELADRGTIVAVYDTMPAPGARLRAKRPWEPGTADRLWRATAIDGNTTIAALTGTIEQLAAEIDGFGEVIQTQFERDAISMDDTADLACLLERRTHDSLEELRKELRALDRAARTQTRKNGAPPSRAQQRKPRTRNKRNATTSQPADARQTQTAAATDGRSGDPPRTHPTPRRPRL